MPVIPATREDESGELPEPRRWRLQWAEIAPLHSSLGNKSETPFQKKNKQKTKPYLLINKKCKKDKLKTNEDGYVQGDGEWDIKYGS